MAMTVAHNSASAMALNELNTNSNRLSKDLKKISSGVRITGAGDGASEYAISEKMRTMIRALDQDVENTKKGRDLVKVAEGGIQNIIEELRTLKELALNSANDHNSDFDRTILQKEFDARKAHIDSVATDTNYNGIMLLDGRWSRYTASQSTTSQLISQTTSSSTTKGSSTIETLPSVTSIKNVTLPKTTTTETNIQIVNTEPTDTDTKEETETFTNTETTNTMEGPTTRVVSSTKTDGTESTSTEHDYTTVVNTETFTSTKTTTTVDIKTDTTTLTKITKTTMTSVNEITSTTPAAPIIINNGTTEITNDGLYEFAPDYTGTLSISAKKVQLNAPTNGEKLREVYIKDTGVEDLYIKNLNIENKEDVSTIAFDSSTNNTLHVLGINTIRAYSLYETNKAVVNAGGGLNIVGSRGCHMDIFLRSHHQNGALIGSDKDGTCGDIAIGQVVTVNAVSTNDGTSSGAGIGSGFGGACGNISIGTDSFVVANTYGRGTGHIPDMNFNSHGAGIGSGANASVKDILIYSGGIAVGYGYHGAGIGTGAFASSCGNITVYGTVGGESWSGAGIGCGNPCGNLKNNVGDIIIPSDTIEIIGFLEAAGGVSRSKAASLTADPVGISAGGGEVKSITKSAGDYISGGILDLSELSSGESQSTTYEVTTTTITTTEVTKTITETRTATIETFDENEVRTTTSVYENGIFTEKRGNPLIIQTGPKPNEQLRVYIEDMGTAALGIMGVIIDPQEAALSALEQIDQAIEYALDQVTNMGAYISRLEMTEDNLVTADENIISSESTIRDADMAKEMVSYTKNNILSQAAQAMLAQANQNSSSVLQLLQ